MKGQLDLMSLMPVLRLEAFLSRGHRSLWQALQIAEETSQDHLAEDIRQILVEVERVQERSLRRGGRLRTR